MAKNQRPLSEPAVRVLRAVIARQEPYELKSLLHAAEGSPEVLRSVLYELERRWLVSWERKTAERGHAVRARARGVQLLENAAYRERGLPSAVRWSTVSH